MHRCIIYLFPIMLFLKVNSSSNNAQFSLIFMKTLENSIFADSLSSFCLLSPYSFNVYMLLC